MSPDRCSGVFYLADRGGAKRMVEGGSNGLQTCVHTSFIRACARRTGFDTPPAQPVWQSQTQQFVRKYRCESLSHHVLVLCPWVSTWLAIKGARITHEIKLWCTLALLLQKAIHPGCESFLCAEPP